MPEPSCRQHRRRRAVERFIVRGTMMLAATNLCVASPSVVLAEEIHVCRRPPNVPLNWGRWSYTSGGKLMFETDDNKTFQQKTTGLTVYVYDPWAVPGSMKLLPMPHNKLPCPPPFAGRVEYDVHNAMHMGSKGIERVSGELRAGELKEVPVNCEQGN